MPIPKPPDDPRSDARRSDSVSPQVPLPLRHPVLVAEHLPVDPVDHGVDSLLRRGPGGRGDQAHVVQMDDQLGAVRRLLPLARLDDHARVVQPGMPAHAGYARLRVGAHLGRVAGLGCDSHAQNRRLFPQAAGWACLGHRTWMIRRRLTHDTAAMTTTSTRSAPARTRLSTAEFDVAPVVSTSSTIHRRVPLRLVPRQANAPATLRLRSASSRLACGAVSRTRSRPTAMRTPASALSLRAITSAWL